MPQLIACLPLLRESERRELLYEWNRTQIDVPTGQCVHLSFELQTTRTPDALVIICEDASLNYFQLNGRPPTS